MSKIKNIILTLYRKRLYEIEKCDIKINLKLVVKKMNHL